MSARYLTRRNNLFYFRTRIPTALKSQWHRSEIKISLRTYDKKLALYRYVHVAALIFREIELALQGKSSMKDLNHLLNTIGKNVATYTRATLPNGIVLEAEHEGHPEREREQIEWLFNQLEERSLLHTTSIPMQTQALPATGTGKKVSECFKDLQREKTNPSSGQWKAATIKDYQDTCNLYIEYLGEDKPFNQISKAEHTSFKQALQKLPSNRSKKPAYRNKSINELLEDNIPESDLMKFTTINNHLTRLNTLINSLREEEKTDLRPLKLLQRSRKLSKKSVRAIFSRDEIQALTSHQNYKNNKFLHDHYYWLIPLGLYTGCRLRELCQLETKDVIKCTESGVWFLSINEDISSELTTTGIVKSVKTESGERLVPIHSHLIELGFIRFVDSKRHDGKSNFVFSLVPDSDGDPSRNPSKWFQRYRKDFEFDVDKGRKDFHSLRHTFIDSLDKLAVRLESNRDLAGHAQQGTNSRVYRKTEALITLKHELEKLCYREVLTSVKPWTQT